jgi:hypothetical protein
MQGQVDISNQSGSKKKDKEKGGIWALGFFGFGKKEKEKELEKEIKEKAERNRQQ